ncbi:MAG: hypothetical protein MZW92_26905 [Comamonadaceae bacterium]|nr:hypothetical protein [Comamonadaceae bacterium]
MPGSTRKAASTCSRCGWCRSSLLRHQPGDGPDADPRPGPSTGSASSACWPAPLVYVNAGTQLARIDSLAGILSPGLLGSLRAARHLPADRQEGRRPWSRRARSMSKWRKPRTLRPQPGGDRRRLAPGW